MKRKLDELGRIVLPFEYRSALQIQDKDELDLLLEGNRITIQKPLSGCYFCHSKVNLIPIGDQSVCKSCMQDLCESIDDGTITPRSPASDSRKE